MNEIKNVKIFEIKEFGVVKTLIINDDIWFVGKDIAEMLGYNNTKDAIISHVDKEDRQTIQKSKFPMLTLPNRGLTIINKRGLLSLISKSQKLSSKQKQEFLNIFGMKDKIILSERKEIRFLTKLKTILQEMNIPILVQFKLNNYRIDAYLSKQNIAIEYDENNHKYYDKEQEIKREKFISEFLNATIIRVSDKDDDYSNIGKVLKAIFDKEK